MMSGGKEPAISEVRRQKDEGRSRSASAAAYFCLLLSAFCIHHSLHERNLIDFPQGGSPFHHFLQRRLSQERHAFVFGRFLDLRCRASIEDHAANTIGEIEKFRDRRTAVES